MIYPNVLNVTFVNGLPGIMTPMTNSVITFNPIEKAVILTVKDILTQSMMTVAMCDEENVAKMSITVSRERARMGLSFYPYII